MADYTIGDGAGATSGKGSLNGTGRDLSFLYLSRSGRVFAGDGSGEGSGRGNKDGGGCDDSAGSNLECAVGQGSGRGHAHGRGVEDGTGWAICIWEKSFTKK